MADYTIAAIPTLYRSRLYRSRLEARWAAFFDRLGWTHEYEPFDLGAWSPDFAITNPFDALIEIKPITEPDPDLFMRVQGAAGKQVAFVTRVAPTIDKGFVWFGWWAYSGAGAGILWLRDETEPSFRADIYSHSRDRKTWVTCTVGKGASEDGPYGWSYGDYTMGLWADACNAVQWEPVR